LATNSQRQTRSDYCRQSACAKELEEQIAKTAGLAKEPGEPGWDQPKHLRVPRGIRRTLAELEKEVLRGLADEVPGACAAARSDSADDHDSAALFDGQTRRSSTALAGRNLLAGMREGAIRRHRVRSPQVQVRLETDDGPTHGLVTGERGTPSRAVPPLVVKRAIGAGHEYLEPVRTPRRERHRLTPGTRPVGNDIEAFPGADRNYPFRHGEPSASSSLFIQSAAAENSAVRQWRVRKLASFVSVSVNRA
jgi:hypothetical protein